MIHLDLEAEEHELLLEVLERYLGDLRAEIADTDSHDYRQSLKREEEVLNKLLAALRKALVEVKS